MDCSTPGFPVHHQLPEPTQTHVHRVSDAIQPSHPHCPCSCLQSFPASGSSPMSWFFASDGQQAQEKTLSIADRREMQIKTTMRYHPTPLRISSVALSCPILRHPMDCSTPGLPVHHHLAEPTQTHVHRVSGAIQPSHPLSSPSPAPNPESSNESTLCMRWPKYWSFSFSIIPSTEIPGSTSFRMDWLDLLAVQGTLKSLLQHHSSKASILWCSAVFTVQLSHPYMTTGETIALTRRTLVGKIMSLLLNMLSRLS